MDRFDAIVEIANNDAVKKRCEPNLMWHSNVDRYQYIRLKYAEKLYEIKEKEWRKKNKK